MRARPLPRRADDGANRQEFRLDDPLVGLYMPPMVWGVQYQYSEDAVLLVLASAPYEASDYIPDYSEFLKIQQAPRSPERAAEWGQRVAPPVDSGRRSPAHPSKLSARRSRR